MKDKIDKYIEEEFSKIDKEVEEENNIREYSSQIRKQLENSRTVIVKYNNTEYELGFIHEDNTMMLIRKDIAKEKIAGNKYRPFIVTGEFNNDLSLEQNYETVISAFLGHISGKMIIESDNDIDFE